MADVWLGDKGVPQVLTVREAAEQLRVCTATVYSLVGRGELSSVRVSNAIRIEARALAAYVAGGGTAMATVGTALPVLNAGGQSNEET